VRDLTAAKRFRRCLLFQSRFPSPLRRHALRRARGRQARMAAV